MTPCTDLKFGEMEFGEMKRNTSNWSNFCMPPRRAGLTASAGLSCNIGHRKGFSRRCQLSRSHKFNCRSRGSIMDIEVYKYASNNIVIYLFCTVSDVQ